MTQAEEITQTMIDPDGSTIEIGRRGATWFWRYEEDGAEAESTHTTERQALESAWDWMRRND